MVDYSEQLGPLMRYHRRSAGLSQIELAKLAGVSRTVVQRLEQGNLMASWQNVLKLLAVLTVEIGFESPLMEEFERMAVQTLETHLHALIRERAGEYLAKESDVVLPTLSGAMRPGVKRWLSIPRMAGGFQYWLERSDADNAVKLIVESWNRDVPGSEARHEITSAGAAFVGRVINGVDFSAKA